MAVLLASEMVTNSLLHGGSAGSGEAVTVTVVVWDAGVRVEVTGPKMDGVPVLRGPDDEAATEVRVAGMADVPGTGGHEEEDTLAITERYRIR